MLGSHKVDTNYMQSITANLSVASVVFRVSALLLIALILGNPLQVARAQSHGDVLKPSGNGPQSINPYLEYLDDPESKYSIDEVAGGRAGDFKPLLQPNYGFGYRGVRWVRFTVDNTSTNLTSWFIHQNYQHIYTWSIFYPEDDGFHERRISTGPSADRTFKISNLILELPAKQGPVVYYGRFETRGHPLNINLLWLTQKAVIEYVHNNLLASGLFFGGLVVLILYNAFICFTLRSKVYLQYIYYLTAFAVAFFYLTGLSPLVIDLNVKWKQFFSACAFLVIHGMTMFGRNILELKDSNPLAARYLKFCESLLLIGAVGSFFAPIGIHFRVLNPIILISAPVLIVLGIRKAKQGYVPAQIYSVGWFLFIGSLITYVFMQFGMLPLNWFTMHAVQFASVLEATLFSLALALRFKIGVEQAAKAKNSFIGMISHELKTPLQSIVSSVDILSSEFAFAENQKAFHKLRAAVETLEIQVGDLTDYARLESGKLTLRESIFTPEQIVQAVLEDCGAMAGKKGLEICVETIRGNVEIQADLLRVRQVMGNLVENAVKYTHVGKITVRAGIKEVVQKLEESTCELLLEVQDTGIGISERHLSEIYEPFTQVDKSTDRKYEGVGMGLTIVKNLVSLMNGKIEAESTLGKGSIFSVSIPCKIKNPTQAVENDVRILLVDDNEEVRQSLEFVLGKSGFKFQSCSTGYSAVFHGKVQRYSSVLLDVNIPDLDGFAVATRLRRMSHHRETPIIWISATRPDLKEKEKIRAFTHFLEKPIHADKLNSLLNSVLEQSRQPQ